MPHINISFYQGTEQQANLPLLTDALTAVVAEHLGVSPAFVSITLQPVAKAAWDERVLHHYIDQPGYQVIKPVTY